MLNHCLRRGAAVVTSAEAPVHVSGHARADELRALIRLLRPRYFLPIHGEYRQLQAHARLAVECGLDASSVLLADTGDVIAVGERGIATVDRVGVGQVFIDTALDPVDAEILRDRRRLAGDGLVIPIVALPRGPAAPNGYLEIVTRGFVGGAGAADDTLLAEARRAVEQSLAEATPEERADEGLLKARIQTELRRFLRRRTQRRPLVIPVVLEL
jgi:ribonuclease J